MMLEVLGQCFFSPSRNAFVAPKYPNVFGAITEHMHRRVAFECGLPQGSGILDRIRIRVLGVRPPTRHKEVGLNESN